MDIYRKTIGNLILASALLEILNNYGINKIFELSSVTKEPRILGDTLARILENNSQVVSVFEQLVADKPNIPFVQTFIFTKSRMNGFRWSKDFFNSFENNGWGYQ